MDLVALLLGIFNSDVKHLTEVLAKSAIVIRQYISSLEYIADPRSAEESSLTER